MPEKAPLLCVVGARPNFMKMAAVLPALRQRGVPCRLVHTGQHYGADMMGSFFDQLGIPAPDENLEVGSGSHAWQTAEIMKRFETVLLQSKAAAVLVVGDVNSTVACALVAAKLQVPVIHVEAGLRSFDRTMPEEINRVLTDQLSQLLFTTEREAEVNLLREGISRGIHFVGNVMIDTLLRMLPLAPQVSRIVNSPFPLEKGSYGVVTLHRPSNVDAPETLEPLLRCLGEVARHLPLILPLHPRTQNRIEAFGLGALLQSTGLLALPPLGYVEMLGLMRDARLVLTDSGGIQEETTALGVPCLTARPGTERPITVTQGTNTITGSDPERILGAVREILEGRGKAGRIPELWDGRAGERIAAILQEKFAP
ncbi:MAG: UDP-N-acetylglucosamine 2-epimerase (non-hydrolyzing) [Magnetococcales bacterium]|nr:UDP-N-acetylglucosamine 2-epimerase (non-hydrolyzing) [Magnetococcales bacterium]